MIISEDQANKRINSEDNLVNLLRKEITGKARLNAIPISDNMEIRPAQNQGPRKGDKRIPGFLREIIAVTAQTSTNTATAAAFGISDRTVDDLGRGLHNGKEDPKLQSAIDKTLEQVRDKAIDKLMSSLGFMNDDKLKAASVRDLSSIASNMSKIVVNSIPQTKSDDKPRIIVYAPEVSQVNNYQVLDIE